MNAEQIIEQLESNFTKDEVIGNDLDINKMIKIFGKCTLVEQFGGINKGYDYWKIFHFIEHNIYIKLHGYFSEYSGIEPGIYEHVIPKEIFETQYESAEDDERNPLDYEYSSSSEEYYESSSEEEEEEEDSKEDI